MRRNCISHLLQLPLYLSSGVICLFLYLIGWKRQVISKNIELCRIPKKNFSFLRFYFKAAMDMLLFLTSFPSKSITVRTPDNNKLDFLRKNGGLVLTAHFNNWELLGGFLQTQQLNLLSYAKPLTNRFWNFLLMFVRRRFNNKTVQTNVPKTAMKWIKGGNVFGLILDQRVDDDIELFPFFDLPVSISRLPIFLSRTTQCAVFFVFLTSKYQIRLIQLTTNKRLKNEKVVIKRYHKILEQLIKNQVESWYGITHRRFIIKNKNPY